MAKKVDAPKIEFPSSNYPIKVLGESAHDYEEFVIDIMRVHAPGFDAQRIKINSSSNGRFTSMTFFITADSAEQLEKMHKDLIQHKRIRMVL
ncbi:MAG: putative lipoic acid-binding regulatory protein [Bermanella sp.]|jgi:putative lipoic acid-binding regulatory protein